MRKKIGQVLFFVGMLLGLLFGTAATGGAQNAASLLDKAAGLYEDSNGMEARFAMHNRSDIQQVSESFEGTIAMKGDKFVLTTPDMITWFDGTTQWVYLERNEEVNVSHQTGDELQMTNPALLLRLYKKGFTPSLKGESTTTAGKAAYEIELLPKKKSDILKVNLQIEKLSGLPASISVESKNGMVTTIRISQVKMGLNQPDSFFVFNEADYPDAEVIDLR